MQGSGRSSRHHRGSDASDRDRDRERERDRLDYASASASGGYGYDSRAGSHHGYGHGHGHSHSGHGAYDAATLADRRYDSYEPYDTIPGSASRAYAHAGDDDHHRDAHHRRSTRGSAAAADQRRAEYAAEYDDRDRTRRRYVQEDNEVLDWVSLPSFAFTVHRLCVVIRSCLCLRLLDLCAMRDFRVKGICGTGGYQRGERHRGLVVRLGADSIDAARASSRGALSTVSAGMAWLPLLQAGQRYAVPSGRAMGIFTWHGAMTMASALSSHKGPRNRLGALGGGLWQRAKRMGTHRLPSSRFAHHRDAWRRIPDLFPSLCSVLRQSALATNIAIGGRPCGVLDPSFAFPLTRFFLPASPAAPAPA